MLAWAAWQLQFSPVACGTLRKHVTKPFPQPAAPPCTYDDFSVEDSVSADGGVAEHRPREVVAVAREAQGATRYVGAVRMTWNYIRSLMTCECKEHEYILSWSKRLECFAKQDPGRARQSS